MAYMGRGYQKGWTYDPNADDFNARVGKILSQGHDLQGSLRTKALGTVSTTALFEQQEKINQRTNTVATADPKFLQQTAQQPRQVDTTGYAWVDPKGNLIASASEGAASPGATSARSSTRPVGPPPTATQALFLSMDPTQRSMHMWRRVNAGCVESTTKMPISTFKDHFQHQEAQVEKPDKTHHLQKTEFSHYTEVKLKLMNHIKGNQ